MRVYLGGEGEAIPLEALPDLSEFGTPLTLNLPDDVPFVPADYIAFGYTNYEALCIGGSGGRGGLSNFNSGGIHDIYGVFSYGGAGGGGGLHLVSGLLLDLPSECAVVVGAAGVNGADGVPSHGAFGGSDGHGTIDPGDAGTDGGASSFSGTLCRASGGKGGAASLANAENSYHDIFFGYQEIAPGGNGGQGGKGGRTIAGGGADGAIAVIGAVGSPGAPTPPGPKTNAEDGTWDGTIGEGGGGGRGGTYLRHESDSSGLTEELQIATSGGKGTFNFGDTSRYGPGEIRSSLNGHAIVPGGGGGGKPTPASQYGGRGPNAHPEGVVILRLTKVA